jgi:hypothetical protein
VRGAVDDLVEIVRLRLRLTSKLFDVYLNEFGPVNQVTTEEAANSDNINNNNSHSRKPRKSCYMLPVDVATK